VSVEAADLPDLRDHVRSEHASLKTVLVRGGPDSVAKLRTHAERVRRAFVLDGAPVLGISVSVRWMTLGRASTEWASGGAASTYRVVHLTSVGRLVGAEFSVLPTFGRPHITVLLTSLDETGQLFDLLGSPQPNPGYGETRRRRRGDTR